MESYYSFMPDSYIIEVIFLHPFTGSEVAPTEETIDSYMVQLHSLIVNNPQHHQGLIQTVRGIVSQLALT